MAPRTLLQLLPLIALSQSLIGQTQSTVSLITSANPSVYGTAVTLTATLTPSAATGKVTFYDGPTILGIRTISAGQAQLTTRALDIGVRSLHARYAGNATYAASDSNVMTQAVNSVAAGSLGAAQTYAGAGIAWVPGDFNGDLNIDLAGCSFITGNLEVVLGNSDGTFQTSVLSPSGSCFSVLVGDMNGDGIPDLVASTQTGIEIRIGKGDGTFASPVSYPALANAAAIADFNGDGKSDVLTALGPSIQVWLGQADGTLAALPVQTVPGSFSGGVALGDFDGDGKIDAAVLTPSLTILLGNGDGTFRLGTTYPTSTYPAMMAAADFNGDGSLDLAVATGDASVSVFLGNGDATFRTATKYPLGDGSASLAIAISDFSGDGKPDLAVTDSLRNQILVLAGRGDGSLQPPVHYAVPYPTRLATGDFNGDGRVDLAVAGSSNGLSVLLGQAADAPTIKAISVNPSVGLGVAQNFAFQFSDTAGAADIASMSVMFFHSWNNTLASACVVTYTRATNSFSLSNDNGTATTSLSSGGAPGSLLQNSQCNVDAGQSGAAVFSGNNQQLTVSVGFLSAFGGTQTIAAMATSAGGTTTGWQELGTWIVPAGGFSSPQISLLAPSGGTGFTQTFVSTYVAPIDPAEIDSAQLLIGSSTAATSSCAILYQPVSNQIWLATDSGTGWLGPKIIGSPSSIQNSQCTVNAGFSSATWSQTTLTLALSVTFKGAYSGAKSIYGAVNSLSGNSSGWKTLGAWTVGATSTPGSFLVSTIAGAGFPATHLSGKSAVLWSTGQIAVDAAGDLYFADTRLNLVYRLDPSGGLTRIAGTGAPGFSGDGGPAVSAQLQHPTGIAVDSSGNVYVSDQWNYRIRRISVDGIITTIAGIGFCCLNRGDNGPATSATFTPGSLAVNSAGNLFFTDGYTLRKIDRNGIITTTAGSTTSAGFSGDNGPAAGAQFNGIAAIAIDALGNIFVADSSNQRVRKIDTHGNVTTVAGNGAAGFSGDNGPAISAQLSGPSGVAVDAAGNLYIGDTFNSRIRKVSTDGVITTIAGMGDPAYSGDGGVATSAALYFPTDLAVDSFGSVYIADGNNCRIRKVTATTISTAAGGGSGDANAAPVSRLSYNSPTAIARDSAGNLYIADSFTHRVHMISPAGAMSTIAGTGFAGYSGDSGPATAAQLNGPNGLAVDSNGALYIADANNRRVRKVFGGIITTVAGNGSSGHGGDGGPATSAQLSGPGGLAIDHNGNLYIADGNIRKVSPAGAITTVAGNPALGAGFSGDGGPATAAQLSGPNIALDQSGNLYIADAGNDRVRKVGSDGTINTVAGSFLRGLAGDTGPATAARLNDPAAIALDSSGNLFIVDRVNHRIRMVTPDGVINTIAGNGGYTNSGDGTPAVNTSLFLPQAVTVDPSGNIYVADTANGLIRLLTPSAGPPVLTISSARNGTFFLGTAGHSTLLVSNAPLAGPTNGTVTVTEFVPEGLTIASLSGAGWSCIAKTCTRNDSLNPGGTYPSIDVLVNVTSTAPSQATNQATVGGGGAAVLGAQDLTEFAAPPTTIQTSPAGLLFSVDSLTDLTSPLTMSLSPGPHVIAVPSPQAGPAGSQYAFSSWNDLGPATHTIEVTATATTYTAQFNTQYELTTAVLPLNAGSVLPATGSFVDAGASVALTATGTAPYTFSYWTGAAKGNSNSTSITLMSPAAVTANFVSCDITHDGKVDVADVQLLVKEILGLAGPADDLNHDGAVNLVDLQRLLNVILGFQ